MDGKEKIELSLLLDFYGNFLTERKRQIVDLSVNDDLSLSEISEIVGISRQGVRDAINKAEKELLLLEQKLGICLAYQERQKDGERLLSLLSGFSLSEKDKREAEELIRKICT
jgi:hypothetical protein